jgi:crotonobetainyl-CoA:carnitine CoA-transferase CaiB-like acyl-CoA transferase
VKRLPLEGLTVVSLEQAVAAPFASRQLADLGARVIKIERAGGDFARGYDLTVKGMASYFVWLNRGKQSVVLDLKSEEGRAVLSGLVSKADVFIQNLVPGAVERLGFSGEFSLGLNPRLIHVSISGYGSGGNDQYRSKKAYDLLIQCETGLLSITGTENDPAKVGVSIADIAAGMYAYSGILSALINRGITGTGDILEISMLEALGEWMSQPYFFNEYSGSPPARTGAQHASIAPYGPFATSDGRVFFGIQNEREWSQFCALALEQPRTAADPRFNSNNMRVENRAELHETIDTVFKGLTSEKLTARLDAAGIANARLRDMKEFSAHPQLAARDRWRDVDSPVGPLRSALPPVTSQRMRVSMGRVPELGEHTDEILAEFLPKE